MSAINLTLVSPSTIGLYAACPLRLVLDSEDPKPDDSRWAAYSDFGTCLHWFTQYKLGCPPLEKPSELKFASAKRCPEVKEALKSDPKGMDTLSGSASDMAAGVVRDQSPGVKDWVSEVHSYNLRMMPTRLGRKGELKGFGGSIDLLAGNRSILWDLKFVGIDKVPEPTKYDSEDTKIKNEYLWQIACYHVLEGVRYCGIIWTSRCAKKSSFMKLDFTDPRNQILADNVRSFIRFVQYEDFPRLAWPCRSEANCTYCHHKGVRCPAWAVPSATLGHLRSAINKQSGLAAAFAAVRKPVVPLM